MSGRLSKLRVASRAHEPSHAKQLRRGLSAGRTEPFQVAYVRITSSQRNAPRWSRDWSRTIGPHLSGSPHARPPSERQVPVRTVQARLRRLPWGGNTPPGTGSLRHSSAPRRLGTWSGRPIFERISGTETAVVFARSQASSPMGTDGIVDPQTGASRRRRGPPGENRYRQTYIHMYVCTHVQTYMTSCTPSHLHLPCRPRQEWSRVRMYVHTYVQREGVQRR